MGFIFLRHPETVANHQGLIYGKKDYPYTQKGHKQVEKIVDMLEDFNVDQILTSPLGRAKSLAMAIGQSKKMPITEEAQLEEMNHGVLEGLSEGEARAKYPNVFKGLEADYMHYKFPEGESYELFYRRINQFLENWQDETKTILVVSHGGVIRTAVEKLMAKEPGFSWELQLGNGSLIHVEQDKKSWQIIATKHITLHNE